MKDVRNVAAAILAGGNSSRMGRDKALLEINGTTFIGRIADVLLEECPNVVVIADRKEAYGFLHLPVYEDEIKNCGPLGGIHSALRHLQGSDVVITSCDIPSIDRQLIRRLIEARGDEEVTVASVNGEIQPLIGIYSSAIVGKLEDQLADGELAVRSFLEKVRMSRFDVGSLGHASPLVNINTPEEYRIHVSRSTRP